MYPKFRQGVVCLRMWWSKSTNQVFCPINLHSNLCCFKLMAVNKGSSVRDRCHTTPAQLLLNDTPYLADPSMPLRYSSPDSVTLLSGAVRKADLHKNMPKDIICGIKYPAFHCNPPLNFSNPTQNILTLHGALAAYVSNPLVSGL